METEVTQAEVPDAYLGNYDGFEKLWISNSAMSTFMECGMQGKFRYIDKIPGTTNVRLTTGCATHRARQVNLKQKIESGEDLPTGECTDAARDDVNNSFNASEVRVEKEWDGKSVEDARGIAVDLAVEMAQMDREVFLPEIHPTAVEETIAVSFPGLSRIVVGKFDVREEGLDDVIRDLKTGKQAFGQSKVDDDSGLTTYGLLLKATTGKRPDKYMIDNVVAKSGKPAKTNAYITLRSERQLQQQLARFALCLDNISKGAFMCCNPNHWLCSADWCQFHHICPYKA